MHPEPRCHGCGKPADYRIQCLHCTLPPDRCTHEPKAFCFECLVDRVLAAKLTIMMLDAQGTHPTSRQN